MTRYELYPTLQPYKNYYTEETVFKQMTRKETVKAVGRYTYDSVKQIKQVLVPSGVTVTNTYDSLPKLVKYNEYVIHQPRRALIKYIVGFKYDRPVKRKKN